MQCYAIQYERNRCFCIRSSFRIVQGQGGGSMHVCCNLCCFFQERLTSMGRVVFSLFFCSLVLTRRFGMPPCPRSINPPCPPYPHARPHAHRVSPIAPPTSAPLDRCLDVSTCRRNHTPTRQLHRHPPPCHLHLAFVMLIYSLSCTSLSCTSLSRTSRMPGSFLPSFLPVLLIYAATLYGSGRCRLYGGCGGTLRRGCCRTCWGTRGRAACTRRCRTRA